MPGPVSNAAIALVVLALAEHDRHQGLVGRLVNSAAGVVDVDGIVDEVDWNRVLSEVDIDAVVQRIDLNAALADVNLDALIARLDVNAVLTRVDVNAVLDRVDVNAVLDRVEPDRLLDRVDPNRLLNRVDLDAVVDRMDIKKIVDEAGIADIVAESTGAITGSFMDVVRRQVVGLDTIADRTVFRITRRDPETRPRAPEKLAPHGGTVEDGRRQITGQYAGPVSRTLAFIADFWIVIGSYTIFSAGVAWLANLGGVTIDISRNGTVWGLIFLALFALSYWSIGLALSGKTIGKSIMGLAVVSREGIPLHGHQALTRSLAEPFSFLLLGLGNLMALLSPTRATLHDKIAKTAEIYNWGDRPAELPAPITQWVMKRDPEEMAQLQRKP